MFDFFKNKKIMILGFGKEGIDTWFFLRQLFPKKIIGVGDRLEIESLSPKAQKIIKKDKRLKLHLGKNYLSFLKNYEIIIKSPGVPLGIIKPFLKRGQILTSQTQIFFDYCQGLIIGITGTKGKSTTASLIYRVLKENHFPVFLVGNIGKPVLSLLLSAKRTNIYVYELSSHQLYLLKKSPRIAVFLNLFREHLDYYPSFKEYFKAKQNICRYQKKEDYLIYNPNDKNVLRAIRVSKAKKIPIDIKKTKKIIKNLHPFFADFYFLNIGAALAVSEIFGLSLKKVKRAIKKFKPLNHRLEFVGKFKGIKFYNDSLSTIPETTILALNALKDTETVLLGGFERKQDFSSLGRKILRSKVKNLIFFPTTGERIWQTIKKLNCQQKRKKKFNYFFVNNMKEAVKLAFEITRENHSCLLSPASPSFGVFKNYKQRGNLFKRYVKYYGKAKKT